MNISVKTKCLCIKAKGNHKGEVHEITKDGIVFDAKAGETLEIWRYDDSGEVDSRIAIESYTQTITNGSFSISKANSSKRWKLKVDSESAPGSKVTTVNVEIGDERP